ncbi:calponin homology domain-containing protein DDB_G0272472-like [Macrobrachium rosenbergii]|uniref:calponin homology domain-containing protein DDB_G0272472-like n=1 Tax=Macrobrachium rosenbergii TaxID=79674 RepID=UPI0034D44A1E
MALDNSECLEEAGNVNDDDLEHDISDCEDNSDCYDDDDSDCEVDDHSDIEGNDDLEDAPKKNESILRFEKEKAEKTLILEELLKKVEGLTEDGMQMERHMRQLERLSQEKDREICSAAAEMETLKNEISQKTKDTEKLVKKIEDKDSTLIILESTVAVLQMEKETLHHDLKEMANGRHATEAQLRKLNEDLESLRKENRRKQNRLESLQKENEDKTLRIDGLERQLEVVAIQKQRADEDLQQLAECKAEIVESKKELQKLNEQNLLQDREILRLENECSLKQREVIRLLKESKSIAAEKANGKMNVMTKRIVQLEYELAETKDELDTMEFEKMEATIEIERLQEENMAKDKKITALEIEASVLKEKKDDETAKERHLTNKESEMFNEKKNMAKLEQIEQPAPERKAGKKNALAKTRSLRKPQIDCKALHRRIDTFEERLKEIMASEQHSVGTKRPSKAMAETPIKKPVNREDLHQKMRLESAARLKKLEEESKMVKNLYKINSVT